MHCVHHEDVGCHDGGSQGSGGVVERIPRPNTEAQFQVNEGNLNMQRPCRSLLASSRKNCTEARERGPQETLRRRRENSSRWRRGGVRTRARDTDPARRRRRTTWIEGLVSPRTQWADGCLPRTGQQPVRGMIRFVGGWWSLENQDRPARGIGDSSVRDPTRTHRNGGWASLGC